MKSKTGIEVANAFEQEGSLISSICFISFYIDSGGDVTVARIK